MHMGLSYNLLQQKPGVFLSKCLILGLGKELYGVALNYAVSLAEF